MAGLNSAQEQEVTFLTGVTAAGTVAPVSFGTWKYDSPATYGTTADVAKWGSGVAGTGATITYQFTYQSDWTATEKAAFVSAMHLWSAVANVTFVEVTDGGPQISLTRTSDGRAFGGIASATATEIGSSEIGVASYGSVNIDTSVTAFGPLGTGLGNYGGYPYQVVLHELGHALGLGHGGAYNSGDPSNSAYTVYDSRAWTIMSYNSPNSTQSGYTFNFASNIADNGRSYNNVATTWMPLDIVAIQRLYGQAVNTPLSGGQVFGFNTNIQGDIAKFFDFTVNTKPVVTLWSAGTGNTFDASGFSLDSNISLIDGGFSSVGGLTNNVAIAFGTRIDTAIGGSGNDTIRGNESGNVLIGGAGLDRITGGTGNDHLYGGGLVAVAGDGADTIRGAGGSDYIQGNSGDDQLEGGEGSDRIFGGQGADFILGGPGNDTVNGNLGDDLIQGWAGNDFLRGGQGNDRLDGGEDNDQLFGDIGNDSLSGAAGLDLMTGGDGADTFAFAAGDAIFTTSGALGNLTDQVLDFVDGVDRIQLAFGVPVAIAYGHGLDFADPAAARAYAQQLLDQNPSANDVAILRIGGDAMLFFGQSEAVRLKGIADLAVITTADFV